MRILIRRLNDHHYLALDGSWGLDWNLARSFPSPLAAISFCREQHPVGVQIILKFDDELYDVNLSLPAAQELDSSQVRRLSEL